MIVFGSINLDLIFTVATLPQPGATALGPGYRMAAGGKGANQAVAAARDGAGVALFGAVGRDVFAAPALAELRAAGVDLAGVTASDRPTGCAAVAVDPQGRNLICVASGANAAVTAAQVPQAALRPGGVVLMQMELPLAETEALIARADAAGCRTILNLAPAAGLGPAALGALDLVVVNEGEAAELAAALGLAAAAGAPLAVALSAASGAGVIVTLGPDGAVAAEGGQVWQVGALPVRAVDTTGAGDAFVGVLAAALDRGVALPEALHRAAVAGSLACTAAGAQPSAPARDAIDRRLGDLPPPRRVAV